MADPEGGTICPHCEKAVSDTNFDLHVVHCQRNLERCQKCGEMVARARAEEHFDEVHAMVPCECGNKYEISDLPRHQRRECPKREVTCPYCDFGMPAEDESEHEYFCGSRTELCPICNKYVTNRERLGHDLMVHRIDHGKGVEDSSGVATHEASIGESGRHGAVEIRRERGQGSSNSVSRLWMTAAFGAAVVLIGAYFSRNSSIGRPLPR